MSDDLEQAFRERRPWVTRFVIDGRAYGGRYDAANDIRMTWFREHFPDARTILELGSLEGGHSFALAALPQVERVVALEGRQASLARASFVQELLGRDNVSFVRADLQQTDLSQFGSFDVVVCLGLLYHLPEPWRLVEQIARVSRSLFLWTHYAAPRKAKKTRHGYRGRTYREWLFLFEALSGLSPASFWPDRESLLRMLADHGFRRTTVIDDNPAHADGPAITLAART